MDKWGLPGTSPHYAVGWALAGDTPFQWTKQVASHFGGTRNSMIVSWPAVIKDKGKIRSQFHHVIDMMPTLMEVVGIREPKEVNGYIQRPIEGTSFAYTFAKENAKAPSTRTQQYFEMFGNRAMYSDGWMASCRHGRLPWETSGSSSFDEDEWELYNIAEDFSQSVNLAKKQPERLRRLQDLFMADAAKYNVLPLDDRFAERLDVTLRPSFFYGRDKVTFYPGMVRLPEGSGPKLVGVPFTLTAPVVIPKDGAEGVIFALGGDAAGWSLFLWEGKVRFHYNFFGIRRYDVTDTKPLKAGKHTIELKFTPDSPKPGRRQRSCSRSTARKSLQGASTSRCRCAAALRPWMSAWTACRRCVTTTRRRDCSPSPGTIESVTFKFAKAKQPTGMERLELATKMD